METVQIKHGTLMARMEEVAREVREWPDALRRAVGIESRSGESRPHAEKSATQSHEQPANDSAG